MKPLEMRSLAVVVAFVMALTFTFSERASARAAIEPESDDVLMIVGAVNAQGLPPKQDRPVLALLESLGYSVTLANDDDVSATDTALMDLVVVSSSVVHTTVGGTFAQVSVPVVTWEGYLFDDFGFTAGGAGVNGETSTTQQSLTITDPSHRISAGYTGVTQVLRAAKKFSYGNTVASAQVVAEIGSRPVLFAFEAGASLDGFDAPARRVGLFMDYGGAGVLKPAGEEIVAAAVAWATNSTGIPANAAPEVDAGPDQTVVAADSVVVALAGTVNDDGRPVPPGMITTSWTSPGTGAIFADPSDPATTVTLPGPGSYVLRLSAGDSELESYDEVTITVNLPANQAPVADAGSDAAIVLPTNSLQLDATVSDDGLPLPPYLTVTWSQFSGPGGVVFDDASSVEAIATFPGAGQYVLRLTTDDGQRSSSDDITVNVDAAIPEGINVAYIASKTEPLPSGDRPIRDRLESNGATVTPVDDDALLGDYSGFDLIFLSTSVVYTTVGDHLVDVATPVITTEQYLFEDMAMASARIGVKTSDTIRIVDPGNELAASTTGDVRFTSIATGLGYGQPGPGAKVVATASSQPVYFAYKTGDEMIAGAVAPARRVAFPGTFPTAKEATANYFALLDAAVGFALTPDEASDDIDSDGVKDADDNCTDVANPDQLDVFGSPLGDACETDANNNSILDGDEPNICVSVNGVIVIDRGDARCTSEAPASGPNGAPNIATATGNNAEANAYGGDGNTATATGENTRADAYDGNNNTATATGTDTLANANRGNNNTATAVGMHVIASGGGGSANTVHVSGTYAEGVAAQGDENVVKVVGEGTSISDHVGANVSSGTQNTVEVRGVDIYAALEYGTNNVVYGLTDGCAFIIGSEENPPPPGLVSDCTSAFENWNPRVPNIFSPNGDGIDDTIRVQWNGHQSEEFRWKIYNRWGELVFESTDPYEAWDGTNQSTGAAVNAGVYVYMLEWKFLYETTARPPIFGNITLLR